MCVLESGPLGSCECSVAFSDAPLVIQQSTAALTTTCEGAGRNE